MPSLRGADADFAGDGVDFDAAAAVAHAGAQGMLALLFDHDRHIGLDLAGNGFGGQAEICVGRNAELHHARNRLQIPVAAVAGISLHVHASRDGVCFHVARRALHFDGAAGGVGIHAAAWAEICVVPDSALMRTSPLIFETVTLPEALEARRSSPIFCASIEPLSVLSCVCRSMWSTRIDPEAESAFTGPRTLEIVCDPETTDVLTSVSCGTSIDVRDRNVVDAAKSLPMRMVSPFCSTGDC